MKNIRTIIVILIQILIYGNCQRAKDKMYASINGASCFRRLNGTHQTGCSSKSAGSDGILHVINTIDDFDFVLNSPPSPPYAPIIPPNLFTRENILRLKNDGGKNISAIVLINNHQNMTTFSHDLKCPNRYGGLENQQCSDIEQPETTWNPLGTGLMYEDFPFPIYYVADADEIDKILKCYEKFNSFDMKNQGQRSLCSIQINTFMSGSINSEICIRRTNTIHNLSPTKYCDPLEGKNIFATLFPRNTSIDKNQDRASNKSEKFILVSCRLDTTSMFDGVGLGAMDSLISFSTLVSLGHMLTKLIPEQKSSYKTNVLFAIFNGESYDYIGSQRFIFDLQRNAFPLRNTKTNPINLDQIEFMLDIGTIDQLEKITFYTSRELTQANDLIKNIQKYSIDFRITSNGPLIQPFNLPPTSAQSFLRYNSTFPAIILSSTPKNTYYHSVYDDAFNINFKYQNTSLNFTNLMKTNDIPNIFDNSVQMKIRNLSSVLALALYKTITNSEYSGNEFANIILIDEFLHCFLETADCPLFRAASYPGHFVARPVPPLRYISVSGAFQEASIFTFEILGLLFSQITSETQKERCHNMSLYWYAGYSGQGECRLTTQQYSEALSPAFLQNDYDWKSGKYSTWTESTWQMFSARIYLRPSKIHDTVTLSVGIFILVLSFVLVFLINSRSNILFENIPVSSTITEPAAC